MSDRDDVPSFAPEDFAELVRRHRSKVAELRSKVTDDGAEEDLLAALSELDVAHEELRVAEEELATQRRHIDELVAETGDPRGWRERVVGRLPVAVVVTDRRRGVVVEANAVAAHTLGLRRAHLLRKPLTLFVAESQRSAFRGYLSELAKNGRDVRCTLTVTPRRAEPFPAILVGAVEQAEYDGQHQLRWVLVPAAASSEHEDAGGGGMATASAFAELCRLRVDDDGDQQALLARIATLSRIAVPQATGLSVTLGHPKAPDYVATESAFAQAVDGAQYQADEGPCVGAYDTRRIQLADDVAVDTRWPAFARLAGEVGVRSVVSAPILSGSELLGVLNVYADVPDAFDEEAIEVVDLLSAAVAAVVQDARERASLRALSSQLQEAMASRAQIEQAKGMVMAAHGCDADEAFERLVVLSRNSNTKLRDVAARLVAEHLVPAAPPSSGTATAEDAQVP